MGMVKPLSNFVDSNGQTVACGVFYLTGLWWWQPKLIQISATIIIRKKKRERERGRGRERGKLSKKKLCISHHVSYVVRILHEHDQFLFHSSIYVSNLFVRKKRERNRVQKNLELDVPSSWGEPERQAKIMGKDSLLFLVRQWRKKRQVRSMYLSSVISFFQGCFDLARKKKRTFASTTTLLIHDEGKEVFTRKSVLMKWLD